MAELADAADSKSAGPQIRGGSTPPPGTTIGRSLKHPLPADLYSYGIAFISPRDSIDLSTSSGRVMFQIIGAMAEF